jgi:riboflavin biosynthesis pyrimidine reductase
MSVPHTLDPLETLYDAEAGQELALPPELAEYYGRLGFAAHQDRPHVIANFVTTLDGVVALDAPGHGGGGEISGNSAQDRAVMGLLRAVADAVIVGAGTLRSVPRHLWTAEHIYPPLARSYTALRASLGKGEPPLNVIVTVSGDLDLGLPVFTSGKVPALIVTTARGALVLRDRGLPARVQVVETPGGERVTTGGMLEAVCAHRRCDVVLVEGGPHLMADFFAERRLDELFLTLAPQVVGRDAAHPQLALMMGQALAPERSAWGSLLSVKRGGSHLFLRYTFARPGE